MENKITESGLAAMIALATGRPGELCERFLKEFFLIAGEELAKGENVRIKGLGTFKIVDVEPRRSVDVGSGSDIEIPAHKRVIFVASKELASQVNAPFEAFEAVEVSDALPTDVLMGELDNPEEEGNAKKTVSAGLSRAEDEVTEAIADSNPEFQSETEAETSDGVSMDSHEECGGENKHRQVISFTAVSLDAEDKNIGDGKKSAISESAVSEKEPDLQQGDDRCETKLGEEIIEADRGEPEKIVVFEASGSNEMRGEEGDPAAETASTAMEEEGLIGAERSSSEGLSCASEDGEDIAASEETEVEDEAAGIVDSEEESDGEEESEPDSESEGDEDEEDNANDADNEDKHSGRFGRGFLVGFLSAAVLLGALVFIAYKTNLLPDKFLSGSRQGNSTASVVSEADNATGEESPSGSGVLTAVDSIYSDSLRRAADLSEIGDEDAVPTQQSDEPVYDTVSTTRYLTTMAQQYYGDYNLWPIIYKENQDILGDPDRIKPGTRVVVPPLSKYNVDPLNPEDVKRMKKEGAAIYEKFRKK